MNVDDLIRISIHNALRDHNQASCEHNEIDVVRLQFRQQRLVECFSRCKGLRGKAYRINLLLFRTLQRIRSCIVADDNGNLRVCDGSLVNRIQNRLQVRAAAGDENC